MKRLFMFFSFLFLFVPVVHAESLSIPESSTQIKATITEITSATSIKPSMNAYVFQAKAASGEIYKIDTVDSAPQGIPITLRKGQKIFLQKINSAPPRIYFEGVDRTRSLWLIGFLFLVLSLAVGLKRGLWSLIGLGITLLVLFGFIFPSILHGRDVLTVTILGSIGILAVNMHIAHGLRRESFLAFISTVIGFFCVWIFANLFTAWTQIGGTGSEDAMLLVGDIPVQISTIRLYLAGVILGTVGVLDDIAISQTEIVHELIRTNAPLSRKHLFLAAMRIGRHHIASTINTLVLVYAGASMPVLILFLSHSGNINAFLNSEIVTEELVRTLAGTMALILTVPISTLIATYGFNKKSLDTPHKHT